MEEKPKRRWFRFGLRAALGALSLFSALLASYRLGVEHERKRGLLVPSNFTAPTIYDREYDISDIIKSKSDAYMLIDSLRTMVEPDSGDVVGGFAVIELNSDVPSPFLTLGQDTFRSSTT